MSISLVTNGMLCPLIRLPSLTAPDGITATAGEKPTTPCALGEPTDPAPATPRARAVNDDPAPAAPCVDPARDPTLTPPATPKVVSGHTTESAAPLPPACPEGEET